MHPILHTTSAALVCAAFGLLFVGAVVELIVGDGGVLLQVGVAVLVAAGVAGALAFAVGEPRVERHDRSLAEHLHSLEERAKREGM